MRFSESWLRSFVDPGWSSQDLADALTMIGLEVEQHAPVAPPFTGVVVATVLAVTRHPDADRLSVCMVDYGTGQAEQIVCGAPNVRVGMRVACARPGTVLPGGMTIAVARVRGVESRGMLCSASELGLPVDQAGLLELPPSAPVGACVREVLDLDDHVWLLKVTPNLAHCMSVQGVAREVAALTAAPLNVPEIRPVPATIPDRQAVDIAAPDLCGRFATRVIRGVNARAATPDWIRRRLERAGQRSIGVLVDLSNYLMLETGQPSHVFDLSAVRGPITVRWGRSGEQVALLNGQTVELGPHVDGLPVGVVADANQVLSLAGIMGGQASAVTLETHDVLLEAAFWWPDAIAGRGRRLQSFSDAAQRFERGVDPMAPVALLERLTQLILDLCGGQAGPVEDRITRLPEREPITMRVARAQKVIGAPLEVADCVAVFERLRMPVALEPSGVVDSANAVLRVTPPSYRFDLAIEEDLIEEVLRLWGLDRLPDRPPQAAAVLRPEPEAVIPVRALRRVLLERDWQEVMNYAFIAEAMDRRFNQGVEPIRLRNPIAETLNVMRSTLWGGLMQTLQYNVHRKASRVRVFEFGRVFARDEQVQEGPWDVPGIRQPHRVAGLAYGPVWPLQWGSPARNVDFFDVKGDLQALLPQSVRYRAAEHPALHPGQSAQIQTLDGRLLGWLGVVHPRVWQSLDLPGQAPILFELDVAPLQQGHRPVFREFPRVPALIRDLAWLVDAALPAGEVEAFINECVTRESSLQVVRHIMLFDEYRGKGLENKEKSLAFRLWIQDTERTLSDAQADAVTGQLAQHVQLRFNARLRSS
jgi:phenylalanyl-tRNA synthetase beta chain